MKGGNKLIFREGFNNNFFIGEECIEDISKQLICLVDTYKFSLESISLLSHIELDKLISFYNGEASLHYEEIHKLDIVVIDIFIKAIESSLHNYDFYLKSREYIAKGIPFIDEAYLDENE